MKIYRLSIIILSLLVILIGFSNAAELSRRERACKSFNDESTCYSIPNNYTEPYCFNPISTSVENDYLNNCIPSLITNNFSSNAGRENSAKKDFIRTYCLSLLSGQAQWRIYFARPSGDTWDWQQTFDSHQSLFVYAFCSTFEGEEEWTYPFLTWEDYLIWDAFSGNLLEILRLQQPSKWKNNCYIKDNSALNDCDISIYAAKIYTAIMSDLFKIKYAQALHLNTTEDFEENLEKKIVEFMSGYYNYDKKTYPELEDDYKQTMSVIKSNMQYYKRVLDTIKIINNAELSDMAEESGCPKDKAMTWVDFIACALHGSQWYWLSLEPSFVTMLYNEILHYNLLVTYYSYWVENNGSDLMQWDALNFHTYANTQIKATKQTLRDLEELNMTYPLHIWLLLYQEKIKGFRDKNLRKIVRYFYSLSEKLQNVQLPDQ